MSEPEIVRLKKKINSLTELNVQLQEQVQELTLQVGEYQARNIEFLNNDLLRKVQKEKATNEEVIRIQLDKAISDEKRKTEKFQKENEALNERIIYLEKQIKDNELFIQKLQIDNEKLKKELIDFGEKHEAQDYIDQIRRKEQEISKFDEQRERSSKEYNDLCDKMEKVLSENRVLRQIADVPENFGIDVSKIRIGDRVKIEDYKAKIRILQHDIDDLESERAILKHRIQFFSNLKEVNGPEFHMLTEEQKIQVLKYAQDLYEGKEASQPEKYDLIERLKEKDNQIRVLEDELNKIKLDGRIQNINSTKLRGANDNNQLDMMKKMLIDYKNDIIDTIKTKNGENNFGQNPYFMRSNNYNNIPEYNNGDNKNIY